MNRIGRSALSRENQVDYAMLDFSIREFLNKHAERRMAVLPDSSLVARKVASGYLALAASLSPK